MRSFRTLDRRAGFGLSAFTLLLAMVAPGLVPAFASADTLTDRSVALSSNAVNAAGVSYEVKFTATTSANAFLVEFCDNTPIVGAACDVPAGFSTAGIDTDTTNWTVADDTANSKALVTKSSAFTGAQTVVLDGIHNPNVANDISTGFYVRILTYTTANIPADLDEYDSTDPGTFADIGGVALSINDAIGVSAAVRESLTFCVSGTAPGSGCASNITAPSVLLGDAIAGLSGTVSTQNLFTQISTNAATGAVVNLKSNAIGCGGLLRAGASSACDIKPALLAGDLDVDQAFFGLKLGTATGGDGAFVGTNGYDATDYHMDFVEDDEGGVTSAYGSPVLTTSSAPASNKNMTLTFGAAAAPNTPAGNYSASLNMIATGKY